MVNDFHGGRNTKDWPAASPAPALPESGVNLRIEFHQHDWIPGFAAFAPDATSPGPESKAFCVLNLGSLLAAVEDEEVAKAEVPYLVAETMMHEVMHALEQWAGTEFSEDRIETILHKYRSATPAPTPAPAPAPVDAAGLVARLSAKAQALYQTRSAEDHAGWEAGGALWEAASALAAAAEREAALEEKVRQSALDYLALDMQATEALEREAALVRERDTLRRSHASAELALIEVARERDIANEAREAHAKCTTALIDAAEARATAAASPARSEDEAEAFIQAAIDRAPEPLRRLGEWLAGVLDEDDWKTAERMLLGAAVDAQKDQGNG